VSRRATVLLGGAGFFVLVFVAVQFVPYRVTNSPVQQ
jgi:hypothetical protein